MNRIFFWIFPVVFFACKSNKTMVDQADEPYEVIIEETYLDTLMVTAPRELAETVNELPLFRSSYKRINDLQHTRLDLSFDWENQHVIGDAELYFQAIRATNTLTLHAQNFIIENIWVNGRPALFKYDNQNISIELDSVYNRGESYQVEVKYIARPNIGDAGGSQAIMSGKGLFFINPMNDIKDKPRQIWTQGETQHNSRWFPTIDRPNERCSQEIYVTVENDFETLSNGLLISSTDNQDGTRTDYWKQDLPHAPYLFMLAIGDFSITESQWKDIPLLYYVDQEYEPYAEKIFNHTPEMLGFFSSLLDYPYPWAKYAQVAVQDYVSGAMENTTAVIFGDFVLKTERELIDNHNDRIVAHEMFHHWFGDLVTCESWSNLTMNEGFANYAEYLWLEHKYGTDEAEWHRMNELSTYFQSGFAQGFHDLIDYQYGDRESMFDAHSYNKGGLVLHMLRYYLGEEIFFEGLSTFLETHQYTAVEAHDLRLSMEEVSGEDLIWFFDQWYFSSGHPELEVVYEAGQDTKQASIVVKQIQEGNNVPNIFKLHLKTKVYFEDGSTIIEPLEITKRNQTFDLGPFQKKIAAIVLDGEHTLLGQIKESGWVDFASVLLNYSDQFEDKYSAIKSLSKNKLTTDQIDKAINESHYVIRRMALKQLDDLQVLEKLVENDPHSEIRVAALEKLNTLSPDDGLKVARRVIRNEKAYPPLIEALYILAENDENEALTNLLEMTKGSAKPFYPIYFDLLALSKNPEYLPLFASEINKVDQLNIFSFYQFYRELAGYGTVSDNIEAAKVLAQVAKDSSNLGFKRYLAVYSIKQLKLNLLSQDEKVKGKESSLMVFDQIIDQIIQNTKDPAMKDRFRSLK